jgi:hypothetical protein
LASKQTSSEVDLQALNTAPSVEAMQYLDDSQGIGMPIDMPVYVRAHRLLSDTKEHNPKKGVFSQALRGHTLEVDCFTYAVKLFIKIDRQKGTLSVFAEDADGMEKIVEWTT